MAGEHAHWIRLDTLLEDLQHADECTEISSFWGADLHEHND